MLRIRLSMALWDKATIVHLMFLDVFEVCYWTDQDEGVSDPGVHSERGGERNPERNTWPSQLYIRWDERGSVRGEDNIEFLGGKSGNKISWAFRMCKFFKIYTHTKKRKQL